MKELITMWNNTRMIVLTAVIAAVYAAVLIPFKVAVPIIPGFTEIRPANVIPIVCSLMFGPAAAWGSAIGNTIGDFFGGTFGPGTFFGFIGNFLFGLIPYKMWRALGKGEPVAGSRRSTITSTVVALVVGTIIALYYAVFTESSTVFIVLIPLAAVVSVFLVLRFLSIRYFLIIFSASAACGIMIGWGVHVLGLVPFPALANIIVLNNLVATAVLGPILLPILYPAVKRMGLLYTDIMEEGELSRPRAWGSVMLIIALVLGLFVGNWITIGGYDLSALGAGFGQTVVGQGGLGLGLAPFILLILIAAALM